MLCAFPPVVPVNAVTGQLLCFWKALPIGVTPRVPALVAELMRLLVLLHGLAEGTRTAAVAVAAVPQHEAGLQCFGIQGVYEEVGYPCIKYKKLFFALRF